MIDWDKIFAEAHLHSFPSPSLSIQNSKPKHETSRNIFQEDKVKILNAAQKYGFKIVSPKQSKVVNFVKQK